MTDKQVDQHITRQITQLSIRQQMIVDAAYAQGEVQVEPLSGKLGVTPQTIRRDLNYLCDRRLLQRTHGGAVVQDGVANISYAARRSFMAAEKTAIGATAVTLIPDDSSLFINIGTTTESAARQLSKHHGLLIVTNNINVIQVLRHNLTFKFMLAGGTVRNDDGGIVGDSTAEFIARFKLDYAIIGVSAIEEDGTLLDFDSQEVRVARAIIANARKTILVADSEKFKRSAPMRIANVSAIDYIVTDKRPPDAFLAHCQRHRVEVLMTHGVDRHISQNVNPNTGGNT